MNAFDKESKMDQIYALAKENNKMLRSMQRRAFFGGIMKLLFWAAMIGIPIWLYITYLQPVITDLTSAVDQMQAAGSQMGVQLEGLSAPFEALKKLLLGGGN